MEFERIEPPVPSPDQVEAMIAAAFEGDPVGRWLEQQDAITGLSGLAHESDAAIRYAAVDGLCRIAREHENAGTASRAHGCLDQLTKYGDPELTRSALAAIRDVLD